MNRHERRKAKKLSKDGQGAADKTDKHYSDESYKGHSRSSFKRGEQAEPATGKNYQSLK